MTLPPLEISHSSPPFGFPAKVSWVITTISRKIPLPYSSLFSFFSLFLSLCFSYRLYISHAAGTYDHTSSLALARKPSVPEEVTSACQVNWTVSASSRRGAAVGQVDGEDLVTRSSTGNLSRLKLTVAVWRSPRDAKDRNTRTPATHVVPYVPHEFHLCTFVWVYKTRRTRLHVSCEVACSLPITRWSSLKFAAKLARNGHYRRNARREAVRRSAQNTECPWSCLEFLRGDYIAS